MLRVLSLSTLFPSPPNPGFGKFVANQMRAVSALADSGVDLTMINPIGLPPWPLRLREPYRRLGTCPATSALGGLTVHHPRFRLLPVIGGDSNPGRIVRAVLPLARRLHAAQPFDLIDAQFFFPDGPAVMRIAQALGLPCTIKARGSDIHYWSTRPRALAQIREAAQVSAGMLSVSEALKRDMAALGLPEERITVHYTGLDRALFRITPRPEARARLPELLGLTLPEVAPLIACPGALIAIKGQRFAIEALTELPSAHLALAGTGADAPALRALAQALGLSERVHFLGQVNHAVLPVLMAAADAVVLPSEREGLANVWIEALACGTQLVIPDIGGAREVVRSPAAGRIAAREAGAIAAALREVLAAPVPQEEVAATVSSFSWEENARRLVEFWRKVVGNKG
jgi:glycosyltransferase involved in cell wall biosynthesis